LRTLLRVCSNSHRNSSAQAHGRFLSTMTSRVDILIHININVDFMFALAKSLVSSRKPVLETSLFPLLFSIFFFFLSCVFFSFCFSLYIFLSLCLMSVQMLWSEPTIVSFCYYYYCRSCSSTTMTIVEMSFFSSCIRCHFFSYFEQQ